VVRDRASRRVIGIFTRRDLIVAYGRRMARLKGDVSDVASTRGSEGA
jgi:CBS domain-containing protein